MNKLTTTLAGLALVAAASAVPAFAQGSFTSPSFTFSFAPANSFTVANQMVTYNPFGTTTTSTGFLTLTGGTEIGTAPVYSGTVLSFSPTLGGTPTVTDTIPFVTLVSTPAGYMLGGGPTTANNSVNLVNGAPVPEASTVLSFGALLALGGFAVLRRKTAVQNAA